MIRGSWRTCPDAQDRFWKKRRNITSGKSSVCECWLNSMAETATCCQLFFKHILIVADHTYIAAISAYQL